MLTTKQSPHPHAGFSLIEGLIAILVFSFGALGLIEMQARAVQFSMDAQDRANAAFVINKLISQISLQDTTTGNPDPSSDFLLGKTACSAGVSTIHPAAVWASDACAMFDGASITIARPDGVTTGFLTVTLEWSGRYKQAHAGGAVRDSRSLSVTSRFQWQGPTS
ncbi:prepilin-type N-terminal cleavage/methylation domain-containing protein [Aromatoleum diolicum]|uniref:Type IV pilus modification protein PilV n=1 Tax=Aromatoleum diolicum TaxID=75796 RepID=A0ABX1Q4A8_9RHOO|nr:prepilin-type N-terminal cleavage/methylation domain-containing protein [Aromatoleum diolicum]NMG73189.1 hypothetical protein [Aromatoleum diolicum]